MTGPRDLSLPGQRGRDVVEVQQPTPDIESPITMVDAVTGHEVFTLLGYSEDDPHAVWLVFESSDGDVPWAIDKELLRGGLTGAVGCGDVRIEPALEHGLLYLALRSPHGCIVLEVPATELAAFLGRVVRHVPPDVEERAAARWVDQALPRLGT